MPTAGMPDAPMPEAPQEQAPPPSEPEGPQTAPSGWRPVRQRRLRRGREGGQAPGPAQAHPPPPPPGPPAPMFLDPRSDPRAGSWATWQRKWA